MRSLFALTLTAASVVPMVAPHALEAVAQQPYYQNAGKNLSANLKVDALGGRVVTLSETLTEIIDCNSHGKLWDGANCVAPGGNLTIPDCAGGEVLTKVAGTLRCVSAPAGVDGKDAAVPACTPSQTVVVKNGAFACADESSVVSVTVPKGTLCGLVVDNRTNLANCEDQTIARQSGARYITFNCPTGYSFKNFCSGGGTIATACGPEGCFGGGGSISAACFGSCVKN